MAESGRSGAVEYLGEIANEPGAISKLCGRLRRPGKPLAFCYEAGPCGYGVYRQLTSLGHRCDVVAPSLIPTKAGDRVKANRRDATMLARLHGAGELTPVYEAMRDLIRLRGVVRQIATRARQHLQGFLLRHSRKHGRGTAWRMAYRRWLSTLAFDHPAQQIAFQDYVDAVMDAERRLQRVEEQIFGLLPDWNLRPVVDGLQAMRGIALINAVVLVTEVGVTPEETKDIPGLWIETSEGAKFWLRVMNELKNRGVNDILIAVVDGLKGFPDSNQRASCISFAIPWILPHGRTERQSRPS